MITNKSSSSLDPSTMPVVIVASPVHEDRDYLCGILEKQDVHGVQAQTCREALASIAAHSGVVAVLCDELFPWKDMLSYLAVCCNPPRIVITATLPCDSLCAEFLNMGGFELLAKPFNEEEVAWVISSVCLSTDRPPTDRRAASSERNTVARFRAQTA